MFCFYYLRFTFLVSFNCNSSALRNYQFIYLFLFLNVAHLFILLIASRGLSVTSLEDAEIILKKTISLKKRYLLANEKLKNNAIKKKKKILRKNMKVKCILLDTIFSSIYVSR